MVLKGDSDKNGFLFYFFSTFTIITGVEIIKQSLSVSSLISIFGLGSVQKIVLNQYKLSILALFTFKFPKFQRVYSTELKIKSASKLRKGK